VQHFKHPQIRVYRLGALEVEHGGKRPGLGGAADFCGVPAEANGALGCPAMRSSNAVISSAAACAWVSSVPGGIGTS
jgi:hypothetical protein